MARWCALENDIDLCKLALCWKTWSHNRAPCHAQAPPLSEEPLRIKNLDTGEYMTLEELEAYSAAKAEHGEVGEGWSTLHMAHFAP